MMKGVIGQHAHDAAIKPFRADIALHKEGLFKIVVAFHDQSHLSPEHASDLLDEGTYCAFKGTLGEQQVAAMPQCQIKCQPRPKAENHQVAQNSDRRFRQQVKAHMLLKIVRSPTF